MHRRPRHPAEYYAVALGVFVLSRVPLFAFTASAEYLLYQRYGEAARQTSLAELYRSQDVEYPHLAVWLGSVSRWVADRLPDGAERLVAWRPNKFDEPYLSQTAAERLSGSRFEVGLGIVLFAVDVACLVLVYLIARRAYPADGPRELAARLIAYTLFTGALGLILYDRQDLVVGLAALLAVWLLALGRPWAGYVVLVLGTAYKLVPVLLLPVWVLAAAAMKSAPGTTPGRYLRAVVAEAAVAGLILAAWPAAVYALGGGERGFLFLTFHSARGLQLEAPAAWVVWAVDPTAEVGHGYGSYNLRSALADRVAALLRPLMAASVLGTVLIAARGFWRTASAPGTAGVPPALGPGAGRRPAVPGTLVSHVVAASLLVWLGFILTNKVGSPQYLLWVAPLAPLLPLRRWAEWAWAALFLVELLLTTAVFPCAYRWVFGPYVRDDPPTWAGPNTACQFLLAAKSLTLVVVTAWLAVSVWRSPSVPSPEDSR
ncbi:MAG: hypothetical protein K2X82_01815 [Gemmataceae bacterium]|nr:hypothetical protein [Gemmataceae bacterium]